MNMRLSKQHILPKYLALRLCLKWYLLRQTDLTHPICPVIHNISLSADAEIATNNTVSTNPWDLPQQLTSLYTPKPRLIIIGAGNDVIPVARLAQSAGFRVVVADWRESLCTSERFPEAELVMGFPREIMPLLNVNNGDYLILMSHNFPRERELLEMLVDCEYTYLGIMGSKTRTARLLDGLPLLKYVHSPVGLSIGAAEKQSPSALQRN